MSVFKITSRFLFCFFVTSINAQNLLPNPGFEEVNICQTYDEECCPMGWWSTTPKFVRYNRFNLKRQTNRAKEGNKHMTLLVFNKARPFDRKFIQAPLLCSLEQNKTYRFQMFVKTEDYHIQELGLLFSDTLYFAKQHLRLQDPESIIRLKMPSSFKSEEWTKVEVEFKAKGDEQYLIIGNFQNDDLSQIDAINPKALKKKIRNRYASKKVEFGIDDLSLYPIDSKPACDLNAAIDKIRLNNYRHILPPKKVEPPVISSIAPTEKNPKIEKRPAPIPTTLERGKTIILKNVNFKFGTAILLDESFEELKKISLTLIKNPSFNILIKGHTDNIGSADHNWSLSKERAKRVYDFLIRKGVDRNRLSYKGFGETQAIASNDTEEGRQRNRRVELEVLF